MDSQSEQIIKHIEDRREKLGENLAELEQKVREVTDWRTYYNRNPFVMLGAALAGGVLLSAWLLPGRRR